MPGDAECCSDKRPGGSWLGLLFLRLHMPKLALLGHRDGISVPNKEAAQSSLAPSSSEGAHSEFILRAVWHPDHKHARTCTHSWGPGVRSLQDRSSLRDPKGTPEGPPPHGGWEGGWWVEGGSSAEVALGDQALSLLPATLGPSIFTSISAFYPAVRGHLRMDINQHTPKERQLLHLENQVDLSVYGKHELT